jgi:hypothetical protein
MALTPKQVLQTLEDKYTLGEILERDYKRLKFNLSATTSASSSNYCRAHRSTVK